jgi:hypothetical protein
VALGSGLGSETCVVLGWNGAPPRPSCGAVFITPVSCRESFKCGVWGRCIS